MGQPVGSHGCTVIDMGTLLAILYAFEVGFLWFLAIRLWRDTNLVGRFVILTGAMVCTALLSSWVFLSVELGLFMHPLVPMTVFVLAGHVSGWFNGGRDDRGR